MNDYVQSSHQSLEFQVDNATGRTVVEVVFQETDKVIRQIPDELALQLAEKLQVEHWGVTLCQFNFGICQR